nr:MAG TPA: hypothetical protein [Caudoviricetes sp.]
MCILSFMEMTKNYQKKHTFSRYITCYYVLLE